MEILSILFWYSLATNAVIIECCLMLKKRARVYYDSLFLPQLSPYLNFTVFMWIVCWMLQATGAYLYLKHLDVQWTRDTTMLVVALPFSILVLPALVRLRSATIAILLCVPPFALLLAVCIEFFKAHLASGWFVLVSVVWLGYLLLWLCYVRLTQAPSTATKKSKQKHQRSSPGRQQSRQQPVGFDLC